MFHLPKEIQPYEVILLSCITPNPVDSVDIETLRTEQKYADQDIDSILRSEEDSHFGQKINALYRENTGNPDAEDHDFRRLLFQYFWLNQKKYSDKLVSKSTEFLPTLARHIYGHSF